MSAERIPAEVFPPGDFIREEIEARGWRQEDLAEILGFSLQHVNEVITGKRSVTAKMAVSLGDAFETGAQFWMNLESANQLKKVRTQNGVVSRRAKLYSLAPIKDMVKRQWIEPSDAIDVLEKRTRDFLGIDDVAHEPQFWLHAARKPTPYHKITSAQRAWLFRAKSLARTIPAKKFKQARLEEGLEQLRTLLPSAQEVRHIAHILGEVGVRFLVIEPLPKTQIDGVCFWDDGQPVVALSFRYDRIDWFWFTLMHELGHVKNEDGLKYEGEIDTDLVGQNAFPTDKKPEVEQKADKFSSEYLIPSAKMEDWMGRIGPLYSKQKIRGFALRNQMHPGIVVGQLQRRGIISYAQNREMLEKVRQVVTSSALTDGWGHIISANP